MEMRPFLPDRAAVWGSRVFLLLLGILYLLQIASPLRLNIDSIQILEMAASAADGNGFNTSNREAVRYPPGYSAVIALLDIVGLGTSWMFVLLNGFWAALGVAASYFVYRKTFELSESVALLLCGLVLLGHMLIKHVTLPMTDVMFFGIAMAVVPILSCVPQAQGSRRWRLLLLAAVLIALSMTVRATGVALIPAFLWAVAAGLDKEQWRRLGPYRYVLLFLGTGILLVLVFGPWNHKHLTVVGKVLASFVNEKSEGALRYMFFYRPLPWGELLLNMPRTRVPVPWEMLRLVYFFVGYAGIITMVVMIWRRRRKIGPAEIYMLTFFALLYVWKGSNSRLWLPVLPLMLGWLALAVQEGLKWKIVRFAAVVYVLWFIFSGSAALLYSTRISLSSTATFPDRYGSGELTPAYRIAFEGTPTTLDRTMSRRALALLIRYEPRVHERFKDNP